MKRTKYFKPYTEKSGKSYCTLTASQGAAPGVYIIRKGERSVYVGYSASNVYKTMYRHFQTWNDPTQRRVTYKQLSDVTCRVIFTTPKRAAVLEEALILKLKPRDNEMKLELYSRKDREQIIKEAEESIFVPVEAPF